MAISHLHLVLNHVPAVGTTIAVGLLLLSVVRRSADLRRIGLEVLVVVGLLTLPVYVSGAIAQPEVAERPEVQLAVIQAHHDAALQGSVVLLFASFAGWLGLWQTRRIARAQPGTFAAALVLAIVSLALMGRAANVGAQIVHPEVSALGAAPAPSTSWFSATTIGALTTNQTWIWPAAETLHFVGLWLLFGVMLVVNVRMLGGVKQASFQALHRLLPWAVVGLGINTVTGMVFVIAAASQYIGWPFYWKIGLLLAAGANLLYFTSFDAPWKVGTGDDAPAVVKALAGSSLLLWLTIMYLGRMLPFLGDAF